MKISEDGKVTEVTIDDVKNVVESIATDLSKSDAKDIPVLGYYANNVISAGSMMVDYLIAFDRAKSAKSSNS